MVQAFKTLTIGAAALGMLAASVIPVSAQSAPPPTSGSLTLTITRAILGITLSTNSLTYDQCLMPNPPNPPASTGAALFFPNGHCGTSQTLTVTSVGNVPGILDVQGSDATPSDAGKTWTLCGETGNAAPICTGPTPSIVLPGADQYLEEAALPGLQDIGVVLANTPICDLTVSVNSGVSSQLSPSCAPLNPGFANKESFTFIGPQSSTDPSAKFSTKVTYIVVSQ